MIIKTLLLVGRFVDSLMATDINIRNYRPRYLQIVTEWQSFDDILITVYCTIYYLCFVYNTLSVVRSLLLEF